jgi:putative transposase
MSGALEKRQTVRELTAAGLSQRRACRVVGTSRSSVAYESHPRDEEAVVAAIKAVSRAKPRWGYKRVHAPLRRGGLLVNRKCVERLWRELGYTLPARRPRKKARSGQRVPIAAEHPNHVWTYDFIFDATAGGWRLKILSVLDEFTREALALVCGHSLTAAHVKRVLAERFA